MTAWFVKLPAMPNQWLSTNDFKKSENFEAPAGQRKYRRYHHHRISGA